MAPTRNPPNPAPRVQAAPYQTRSRGISTTEQTNTSYNSESGLTRDTNDDEDDDKVENGSAIANGSREKCTNEQLEALEELFWRSKGFPTRIDKEKVAAQIGKSYHSTNVWMQNRRHPRDEKRKPWFLVPGASDPAIDPTAPLYPLDGIAHNPLDKKLKKEKRTAKGLTSKQKASSKATGNVTRNPSSISTPVNPSNSTLDYVPMRASVTPESSNSSGDSNGSAVSTPRISPSDEVLEEIPPIQTSNNLPTLSDDEAVAILLTMRRDITFCAYGILELTPYVLPIAARYTESSVRPWSAPDDEVASQAHLRYQTPLLRHVT